MLYTENRSLAGFNFGEFEVDWEQSPTPSPLCHQLELLYLGTGLMFDNSEL